MGIYVVAKGLKETEMRKIAYDKGKVDRKLTVIGCYSSVKLSHHLLT